ncbi:MAG: LysE family translocator [Proteobacteria bacterium]|nr:LysE family translocator [Pseudomonadota bacterium]
MNDLEAIGSAAVLLILGAMSPGPSLAVVIRNTLHGGRLNGVICSIGHGLGFGVYALAAILGLATLMREAPSVFAFAQLLGGCLLLYLAFKTATAGPVEINLTDQTKSSSSFIEGVLMAILNPKIALFFLAVFSAVLTQDLRPQTQYLLALTGWAIDTGWYALVAITLSTGPAVRFMTDKARLINPIMALLFCGLALWSFYRALGNL